MNGTLRQAQGERIGCSCCSCADPKRLTAYSLKACRKSEPMKEVIKKLYAKELGLISDMPSPIQRKWGDHLARIREKVWGSQSKAMKIGATALFLALLSATVYYYNQFTIEYYKTILEKTQIEAELQRRNDLIRCRPSHNPT